MPHSYGPSLSVLSSRADTRPQAIEPNSRSYEDPQIFNLILFEPVWLLNLLFQILVDNMAVENQILLNWVVDLHIYWFHCRVHLLRLVERSNIANMQTKEIHNEHISTNAGVVHRRAIKIQLLRVQADAFKLTGVRSLLSLHLDFFKVAKILPRFLGINTVERNADLHMI